jgi:hypothetical protein
MGATETDRPRNPVAGMARSCRRSAVSSRQEDPHRRSVVPAYASVPVAIRLRGSSIQPLHDPVYSRAPGRPACAMASR